MSRRRSRREVSTFTSRPRLASTLSPLRVSPVRPSLLDGRFFSFEPVRSARLVSGVTAGVRLVDRKRSRGSMAGRFPLFSSGTKAVLGFKSPRRVDLCIRRKERREVLHALGRVGRGGTRRGRRYRRNYQSDITCR